MDIGTSGTITGGVLYIMIACDENSGSWSWTTNDCWFYQVYIYNAAGTRALAKYVNDSKTTISSIAGPGVQTAWCVRIVQDVDDPTEKIQCWDGPNSATLTKQITANDTANSEPDNIYTGFFIDVRGSAGVYYTLDDFTVETP